MAEERDSRNIEAYRRSELEKQALGSEAKRAKV
jgi:hypothetical protein